MNTKMREAHRLKKEKVSILKERIESVIKSFESDNDGWQVLTVIVGRDFDCHFAIDIDKVDLCPEVK